MTHSSSSVAVPPLMGLFSHASEQREREVERQTPPGDEPVHPTILKGEALPVVTGSPMP
jgi:hypothetical protein